MFSTYLLISLKLFALTSGQSETFSQPLPQWALQPPNSFSQLPNIQQPSEKPSVDISSSSGENLPIQFNFPTPPTQLNQNSFGSPNVGSNQQEINSQRKERPPTDENSFGSEINGNRQEQPNGRQQQLFNFQPLRTQQSSNNIPFPFHAAPSFNFVQTTTTIATKVTTKADTKSIIKGTTKSSTLAESNGCGFQEANKKMIGVVYETTQAANIKECVKKCSQDKACASAHFYPDTGECYFNSENRITRPDMYTDIDPKKTEDQGVIYLEPCSNAEVRDVPSFANVWKLAVGDWSEWSTCITHSGKLVRYKYRSPCTDGAACMMLKPCEKPRN